MYKKIVFGISFILLASFSFSYSQTNNTNIERNSNANNLSNSSFTEIAEKKATLKGSSSKANLQKNTTIRKEYIPTDAEIQAKIDYLINQNCCIQEQDELRLQLSND